MRRAWRRAVEPIAASAATVVLGLLCLLLSRLGSTRGLGPVGAIGITGALLAALTLLPVLLLWPVVIVGLVAAGVGFALGSVLLGPVAGAVLAALVVLAVVALGALRHRALQAPAADAAAATGRVARLGRLAARAPSGRWLFWPRVPGLDHVHQEDQVASGGGLWGRVARLVGGHPRLVWTTVLVVLLGAACFAPTLQADGISQTDVFRGRVESVDGSKVLARHFPGGSGSPALLVVPEADAADAQRVVEAVPGIARWPSPLRPAPAVGYGRGWSSTGRCRLEATLAPAADSTAGEEVVQRLRTAVDAVGQDVLVGGRRPCRLDVRDASDRDLRVIVPAVLVVILLVLMLLLRAVVAPVLLVLANVLSFAATLGVSALVFDHVFGFPGGDPSIPLYAFVFLVALGIDYSIFLMTRVREEAGHRGPRPGVLVGLAVTGGVITSAGVVLSATFGALGSVPILFLQQVAFIVAFGVLLDTLVVRSLLVPALAHDLGRAAWWPGRLSRVPAVEQPAPVEAATAGSTTPSTSDRLCPWRTRARSGWHWSGTAWPGGRSTNRSCRPPASTSAWSPRATRSVRSRRSPTCPARRWSTTSTPCSPAATSLGVEPGGAGQPDRRARRPGARLHRRGHAVRGRQAAGRRRRRRTSRGRARRAGRRADVRLPEPPLRRRAPHAAALLADGVLGDVLRYEKRWERWRPVPKDRWRERATAVEGGGLLLDLHSHLVDGAVRLLGRVVEVHAELATRTTAAEDDAFLSLLHESGVRSHLGALSTAAAPGPRTRVLGSQAAYVVTEFEGEVTGFPGLASPDDEHTGWVVRGDERSPARTAPGEPADFYREVAAAVRGLGPVPVAPSDAVHVLDVLDAARVSDREHSVVRLYSRLVGQRWQQPRLDPLLDHLAVDEGDDVRALAGLFGHRLDHRGALVPDADAVIGAVRLGQGAGPHQARAPADAAAPRCRSARRCRTATAPARSSRHAGRVRRSRWCRRGTSRWTRRRPRPAPRRPPRPRAARRRGRAPARPRAGWRPTRRRPRSRPAPAGAPARRARSAS
ncbi:hypothetical protein GCM10025868_42570 [Angustibacter aerolatus]|uniref:SSD domain-containing protein n=1 Tax=Angustibacter aerolatus TaxID=1162965 RepID=A0ABQ6JL60_9ACTN|nr:MMPL family transporter [Angustibacter aerolatus]GMA89007.1 hypothetical protein GCM10025868_42570 [Angustibacter aerolatus]